MWTVGAVGVGVVVTAVVVPAYYATRDPIADHCGGAGLPGRRHQHHARPRAEVAGMAGEPTQSYVIWFSQRVGSTVLTQALEDLGVAGRPREWLNDDGAGLYAKFGVADGPELRHALWRAGTGANGVLGVKYGMSAEIHRDVMAAFAGVVADGDPDRDGSRTWSAVFPRCRHVFMTRRDKLRLAVSWWRAIKSGEWHRPGRAAPTVVDGPAGRTPPPPPASVADRYDAGAIAELIVEAAVREADIQAQLGAAGASCRTRMVYEDLIARWEPTVRALLDVLDIPGRRGVAIPPPAFARMADELSDAWVERFRRERAAR